MSVKPVVHLTKFLLFIFIGLLAAWPAISGPAPAVFYNVRTYGAAGDGSHLDTRAINKTIEAAAAQGGGTVYFPAGNYLTGSIHLQSNITLYIDAGATIIAAPAADSSEYDKPEAPINDKYQDYGHSHFHNSLIWGEKLHDIAIEGSGTIWGKGLVRSGRKGDNRANKSISLLLCRNVIIRDVSILHGGWFAILATGTDNMTIDNVKMDTNRDGMDIDCCKNVRISNCTVNSPFDDGICLKSSFALGYARSTDNITIVNCQVSGYDEGTLLDGTFQRNYQKYSDHNPTGRIKMGTESNGGFRNITISNCIFDYCRGLALETVDGAKMEDITISNITMRDIVNAPIFIRLGARMRAPDSMKVGDCKRIILSNITVYNADPRFGCIISGIPGHDIEDLQLNNIRIYYKGGGTSEMSAREVPEYIQDYPEPYRFKTMPSYGFFLRHIDGVRFGNVKVGFRKEDMRSPYILDSVRHAAFDFTEGQTAPGIAPMVIRNSDGISLFHSFGIAEKDLKEVTQKDIR
jgi:polygalacturonase